MKNHTNRIPSLILAIALITTMLTPVSYAQENGPEINSVSIFVDDNTLTVPGESIALQSDELETIIPASLIYDGVLYIPITTLLEAGVQVDFGEDSEHPTIIISTGGYVGPVFERKAVDFSIFAECKLYGNIFNVVAGQENIIQIGNDILQDDQTFPSSIYLANYPYVPAEYVFNSLDIATYWNREEKLFSVFIDNSPDTGIFHFKKENTYLSGQFSDVAPSEWYTESVKAAFEYGLMVGIGTNFNPGGKISIAEAITIAARLHNTYYNKNYDFQFTDLDFPWYQPYVDYALENKIIAGPYTSYNELISRSEIATIMAKVFPLTTINKIEKGSIPDVASDSSYYTAVYTLYAAGIISGTDAIGTFNPDAKISRAEVAVILGSMVNDRIRKSFSLKAPTYPTTLTIAPAAMLLPIGNTRPILTAIEPENADTGKEITWTSSNPATATVDGNGNVTGQKAGIVEITSSTANGISVSCDVTVLSQKDIDLLFAKDAYKRLIEKSYFPDTLEVYGVWADESEALYKYGLSIYIYCSALNRIGQRVRCEYIFTYNTDTRELINDFSLDNTLLHKNDRALDIDSIIE